MGWCTGGRPRENEFQDFIPDTPAASEVRTGVDDDVAHARGTDRDLKDPEGWNMSIFMKTRLFAKHPVLDLIRRYEKVEE
jgi:hypothetical protein